jgi:hypothetical protein
MYIVNRIYMKCCPERQHGYPRVQDLLDIHDMNEVCCLSTNAVYFVEQLSSLFQSSCTRQYKHWLSTLADKLTYECKQKQRYFRMNGDRSLDFPLYFTIPIYLSEYLFINLPRTN